MDTYEIKTIARLHSELPDKFGLPRQAGIVEELMFRAGIFGGLRRFGRLPAYLVCMLLFSVYHVWGYALDDPTAWVYMLQYLPVSFLLCRIYERTNSIWGCILLHMFINFVALNALTMLEKLL